ncbi:MAG: hypothetical protein M1819_001206 [Sarea resinae]|nr:MAG: hypothetical protein M1819_001206 [Sarea resinae]
MASNSSMPAVPPNEEATATATSTSTAHGEPSATNPDGMPASHVEMSNLESQTRSGARSSDVPRSSGVVASYTQADSSKDIQLMASSSSADAPKVSHGTSQHATQTSNATASSIPPDQQLASAAIGPSLEHSKSTRKEAERAGPTVHITLLLINGARHPFKIDEKYLKKRNVSATGMDPFNISVYTLKELIWREWRDEWEARPSSPSSIRLIHFGRLLDDKTPLKDCRFNAESPNVVHMTVRPQELVDEEDAKTAKQGYGRDREGSESTAGCRCVIL